VHGRGAPPRDIHGGGGVYGGRGAEEHDLPPGGAVPTGGARTAAASSVSSPFPPAAIPLPLLSDVEQQWRPGEEFRGRAGAVGSCGPRATFALKSPDLVEQEVVPGKKILGKDSVGRSETTITFPPF
jgi:hypothetical protein